MLVVDASIAFKWLDESEENSEQALNLLNNHLNKREEIIVPELILYELANAWSTKSKLTLQEVADNIDLLETYSLNIVRIDFNFLQKSVKMSKKYGISVYDGIYAVLAEENKCKLISADAKFVSKTKKSNIILLD